MDTEQVIDDLKNKDNDANNKLPEIPDWPKEYQNGTSGLKFREIKPMIALKPINQQYPRE